MTRSTFAKLIYSLALSVVTFNPTQAIEIPGIVQAEAYFTQQGIRTQATSDSGGGLNIGWIQQNDFTKYEVSIQESGLYRANYRVASNTGGGRIETQVNNATVGYVDVYHTGGWQSWETRSTYVDLPSGQQELTLQFGNNNGYLFNVNWVEFEYLGFNIPGKLQVENYDAGGEGISFYDTSTGNSGGQYRTDNVDVRFSNDDDNGHAIGWVAQGEWLKYRVHNINEGYYDINFRVAADGNQPRSASLSLNGNVIAVLNFTATGGWNNWETIAVPDVFLPNENNAELQLTMETSSFDINWIAFSPADSSNGDLCDADPMSNNAICLCGDTSCN